MQDPGDGAGSVESGGDLVDGYGQVGECRLIGDLRSEQAGVHRAEGHAAELGAFEQMADLVPTQTTPRQA